MPISNRQGVLHLASEFSDYSLRSVDAFRSLQRALRRLPKAARLPDPLPDPPPVPLSYLSSLRSRIDSESQLQLQEQIQLVSDLKQQSRKGALAKEMIDLLQRLRSRDDLFARVLQDIDDLIRDIGSVLPPTQPSSGTPPIVDLGPPLGPGTPLELSGTLGSSEGANKIDQATKPKTFALFSRSPTGAFLRSSILSIVFIPIPFVLEYIRMHYQLLDSTILPPIKFLL
jgi:hypothetical protein